MKYKVIDLYAGIGGASIGFQKAGANVIWANEMDNEASKILKYNIPSVELIEDHISNININSVPEFDIFTASLPVLPIPIQDKRGLYNNRENSILEIFRFIENRKPKAIMLETAKLLLNDKGKTYEVIKKNLINNGYKMKYQVLNAAQHGDLPLTSEKLYIVAFLSEENMEKFLFPKEIVLSKTIYDIANVENRKEDYYYELGLKDFKNMRAANYGRRNIFYS